MFDPKMNEAFEKMDRDKWLLVDDKSGEVLRAFRKSKKFPKFCDTMEPGFTMMRVYVAQQKGLVH